MNIEETAYHEAGHLVVAYRLGLYTDTVTIERRGDTLGSSLSEGSWMDGSTDEAQLLVLYAGSAAELRHNPVSNVEGSWKDNEAAEALLAAYDEKAREVERVRLRSIVADMITKEWGAVEAVAQALLELTTLYDDEATLVVDAVDEGKDWRPLVADYRHLTGRHS